MKLTTFSILLTVTLLISGTIIGSGSIQEVEALKSKGVGIQKYGSSTGVCGDRLCSEIPGGYEAWKQQQAGITPIVPDYGLEAKNLKQERDYNILPGTQMGHCNCSEDGTCSCGAGCTCSMENCNCSVDGTCTCGAGCNCSGPAMKQGDYVTTCASCGGHDGMYGIKDSQMKTESNTIQSKTDPGLGHEQHQLAVLLPPSDKMYHGILTYTASENVQLVALHGPLTDNEKMGQTTWTPDGKTHFALTLVDQKNKMGTWMFTGNALAVHTFNDSPFTITYTVHYATISDGHAMKGTCDCAPGCSCSDGGACICSGQVGPCMCGPNCTCGDDGTCQCAEGCSCDKDGVCTCSGEDGSCMCGPNCNCGDAMKRGSHGMQSCNCSEDGTCTCGAGCTCSMENCNCSEDGTCTCGAGCNCSGPAMNHQCQCGSDGCNCPGCSCSEDGTCTCHGSNHQCSCGGHDGMYGTCSSCGGSSGMMHGMANHGMNAVSGTIQSDQDPGMGHEEHQLAVLLPPRDRPYTGLLTYSASENVQLVALHGPLSEGKVKGQPYWTPDGKTNFALTLVDQQNKMGTWMFTGNALAAHTFSTDPFAITYSIVTMDGGDGMSVHEKRTHGSMCNCAADCSCNEDGVCTCSGEEGYCMCGPNCNCGQ